MLAAAMLCLVVAVSDGDSLVVHCGSQAPERVRIASIDAPELRQAWGRRARKNLAQWCLRRPARIDAEGHDRYGRLLAQVHCQGRDVAAAQVDAGLAWVHPSQEPQHPDLAAAQQRARAARQGLWAQKRPQAPWKYRQRHGTGAR